MHHPNESENGEEPFLELIDSETLKNKVCKTEFNGKKEKTQQKLGPEPTTEPQDTFIEENSSNQVQSLQKIVHRFGNVNPVFKYNSLLPTGKFKAGNRGQKFRFLIDTGATHSFATENFINQIEHRDLNKTMNIVTMGQNDVQKGRVVQGLLPLTKKTFIKLNLCVLPHLCTVDEVHMPQAEFIQAALNKQAILDTYPRPEESVDVIIGMDHMNRIVKHYDILNTNLSVITTIWGKIVAGSFTVKPATIMHSTCNFSSLNKVDNIISNRELLADLKDFFNNEMIGVEKQVQETPPDLLQEHENMKLIDAYAVKKFKENLQYKNGQYYTRLLFHPTERVIYNNALAALARFRSMEKGLERKPSYVHEMFHDAMKEYRLRGDVEKLDISLEDALKEAKGRQNLFYLAYKGVLDLERQTTRLRIVFDLSMKDGRGQMSLNDSLLAGPRLQLDQVDLLMQFRRHRVAYAGDISKCFLSINLSDEADKNLLRFFYRDPKTKKIDVYRFRKLIYGATDSPFQSNATIRVHTEKVMKENPALKESATIIQKQTYVDDLTGSHESEERVAQIIKEVTHILQTGGFYIRKWMSNNKNVIATIPEKERAVTVENDPLQSAPAKILGLGWDPKTDVLRVQLPKEWKSFVTRPPTKRNLASLIPSIYDPIGMLSPYVAVAKMSLNTAWTISPDHWDKSLPSLQEEWANFVQQLSEIPNFTLPRSLNLPMDQDFLNTVLICVFGDASQKMLGCCAYMRIPRNDGKYETFFLFARSTIPPKHANSIPRKEAEALRRAARMGLYLQKVFNLPRSNVHLFTDSLVCLAWTHTDKYQLKLYIANCIQEIQDTQLKIFYIQTSENPADLITRGSTIANLASSRLWQHGPKFLIDPIHLWPEQPTSHWQIMQNKDYLEEIKSTPKPAKINTSHILKESKVLEELAARHSNFHRMTRIFAYVLRFIYQIRRKLDKPFSNKSLFLSEMPLCIDRTVSMPEKDFAFMHWLRILQQTAYPQELLAAKLHKRSSVEYQNLISTKSPIQQLTPYLDEDVQLLRVGGRLGKGDHMSFDARHPIIFPRDTLYTQRFVRQLHNDNMHAGLSWTLALVRERFWIPKGRPLIKKVLSFCVPCQKFDKRTLTQLEGPLPSARLNPSDCFTETGFDITGPFYVHPVESQGKVQRGEFIKSYVMLFTCFLSRAVHLELMLGNMDTHTCIMAIRRFISRRGLPKRLYCDNAPQFASAEKSLTELLNKVTKDEGFLRQINDMNIEFIFNVPYGQHRMGVYERLNRTFKNPLRKFLGKTHLSAVEFETVLTEVEAMVNGRPLTGIYDQDQSSVTILTPAHLMLGKPLKTIPGYYDSAPKLPATSNDLVSRWKYRQLLLRRLWDEYFQLYQKELMSRTLWKKPKPNLRVNQLVLLKEENAKRNLWPLGRIIKVFSDKDGLVRTVTVRTPLGQYDRPIQLIVPLEIDTPSLTDSSPTAETPLTKLPVKTIKPITTSLATGS